MKNIKENILDKIKKENIKPIPKTFFIRKQIPLWVSIFILTITLITLGTIILNEVEDINFMLSNYKLFILPNIFWIGLILLNIVFWIISIRKTSIAYRYLSLKNILISIALLLILSFLIKESWFWQRIHNKTLNLPGINLLYNENRWNDVEKWFLIWTIIQIDDSKTYIKSPDNKIWVINIKESHIWKNVNFKLNNIIRVIWKRWDNGEFNAKKIMPWFWKKRK